MSCCDDAIIVRCGTTLSLRFRHRDKVTKEPIDFTGLQARGSVVDCNDRIVLALDSGYFEVQPTEDAVVQTGLIVLTIPSDESQGLSPQNERRELTLYVEMFDGSSPPVVTQAGSFPLVVQPDLTA
jgi:hypothetical protein